ncbi:MAG: YdaU family protein [Comamonas sp.]|uniref:YdaU family protein n=1 Tax=Comamonas sp. TaxID=34028 RepID=UPI002FC8EA21
MHSYPHHIGDWNTATMHLSRLERSVYREALDIYYDTEGPLDGTDFDRLARRVRCVLPEEKDALKFILDEFFEFDIESGLYVHHRCERELAAYRAGQEQRAEVKKGVVERQANFRERRSQMFAVLRERNVAIDFNARMPEIRAAFKEHCPDVDLSRFGHAPVTANQLPKTKNQVIPPNPPAGGAGEQAAAQSNDQPNAGQQPERLENPAAFVAQLLAFFPEKRRTRVLEVSRLIVELVEGGKVRSAQLLAAAAAQSAVLCKDDGKACPNVLRWLKESRWVDASVTVTSNGSGVTGVPSDWRQSRSGIELMGEQLGVKPWDEGKEKLFKFYENRVIKAFDAQLGGAHA